MYRCSSESVVVVAFYSVFGKCILVGVLIALLLLTFHFWPISSKHHLLICFQIICSDKRNMHVLPVCLKKGAFF